MTDDLGVCQRASAGGGELGCLFRDTDDYETSACL